MTGGGVTDVAGGGVSDRLAEDGFEVGRLRGRQPAAVAGRHVGDGEAGVGVAHRRAEDQLQEEDGDGDSRKSNQPPAGGGVAAAVSRGGGKVGGGVPRAGSDDGREGAETKKVWPKMPWIMARSR